jgi:hypothetical protein
MRRSLFHISFAAALLLSSIYGQTELKKISNLSLAPVSTFKNYCARCHGEEGVSYGKGFGALKPDSLKAIVKEMMFGPGGLNPDSVSIGAMISYNKLLEENRPFAAVLNSGSFLEGKEPFLRIESSPGSLLEAENGSAKREKNEDIWDIVIDTAKIGKVKIKIERNNSVSSFVFPEQIYTE